jgi:beta-carotene 3-hydroxylase
MSIGINLLIVLISFLSMEGVAWLTHKYVMHGLLWFLHKDHHHKEHYGFFELNDFFFLIFAIPGIVLLYVGMTEAGYTFPFWIGTGITLYGMGYFFVHDVFIHQRFRWLRKIDNIYFKAIRRAHKMHHKHLQKEQGECFGMLWVPLKYFREAR